MINKAKSVRFDSRDSNSTIDGRPTLFDGVELHPPGPCLVVGGFSGTGKSTLALGLAPSVGAVPGAVVIRSDEIRKRLSGV